MTPVVNHQYKYLFLYSAKVGCTSLRQLYLALHFDELTSEQQQKLDRYHNINEIQPAEFGRDYSDYFSYIITRNPYPRIVSAFLDQYVYARSEAVECMFDEFANGARPNNFVEFLDTLKDIPDECRDSHFQSQSCCGFAPHMITKQNKKFRYFGIRPEGAFAIDFFGDIGDFNEHMIKVYRRIFKSDQNKLKQALAALEQLKKHNSSFYGSADFNDAAQLTVSELDELVFAPKPQDFYRSEKVVQLVNQIYQHDFLNFAYTEGDIPVKPKSKEIELVPEDFDWKMYIRLNPDLPADEIYNERGAVRHFLEFGRFEEHLRAFKIEAPEGFDWQRYLSLHADLREAGINSESAAIEHYISYGIRELRKF